MEIKATLNKPYEDSERMDFIVAQNHQHGYEIRETETALEAWGPTQTEQEKRDLERQVAGLEAETGLIRPLRETITAGQIPVSMYVLNKVQEIDTLAAELRMPATEEETEEETMEEVQSEEQ